MFGIYETLVQMTISPDYVGKIRSIFVRNFEAAPTSSNPEVWTAAITGTVNNYIVTESDLVRGDIVITTDEGGGGSRDIVEISGNWDPPIVKVSYQDASQDLFEAELTKFYIVVDPALGTIQGLTVKGEAAREDGTNTNTWVAVVDGKFTTISRNEITRIGYAEPETPVGGDLISAFNVTYSSLSFARGYNVQIRLTLTGAAGVQTIVVRDDATGNVLASLADGTLTQGSSNREYGFLIPSESDDRSGTLTVEVTTANGHSDEAQTNY
jgi:hypothetical protein